MRTVTPITRREAMKRLGYTRQRQLAEFFGVTEGAVSQWPDNKPLPPLRIMELQNYRPDLFGSAHAVP